MDDPLAGVVRTAWALAHTDSEPWRSVDRHVRAYLAEVLDAEEEAWRVGRPFSFERLRASLLGKEETDAVVGAREAREGACENVYHVERHGKSWDGSHCSSCGGMFTRWLGKEEDDG